MMIEKELLLLLLDGGLTDLLSGTFNPAITRSPRSGLWMAVDNLNTTSFGTVDDIGFYDDADASIEYAFDIDVSGNVDIIENGIVVANNVFAMSTGVDYDLAIQLQDDLTAHYFIYDSTSAAWRRVWVGEFVTSASLLYADDQFTGGAHTITKEAFGTGMTPETVAINLSTVGLNDGSVSGGDPTLPDGDFVMQFSHDTLPSAGSINIHWRYQDSNNYWRLQLNSGNIYLLEFINGGGNTRTSVAAGLTGGETITLVVRENTVRVYYDGIIGFTYTSAINYAREIDWTISSLGTGGAISGLKVWKTFTRNENGVDIELVTNGDFSAWTSDNPDGWTVNESQPNYGVDESSAGVANVFGDGTAAPQMAQTLAMTNGLYYRMIIDIAAVTTDLVQVRTGGITLLQTNVVSTFTVHFIAVATDITIKSRIALPVDFEIDSISIARQLFTADSLGNLLNQAVA